jgi:alpha-beta hydrolase superfamily lysophospholipase
MMPLALDDCRGWLHPADGARGVILCSPHGFEEFCTRQFWRILAERVARAGCPALRLDYAGTADSPGLDTDPGRPAAWLGNILAAIDWMQASTGVREVALVGLRLGGILAAVAAQRRRDISHLVLLAPLRSGSVYRREILLSSRMIASQGDATTALAEAKGGRVEVCGFEISPVMLDELCAFDLATLPGVPAPRILMVENGSRPNDADAVSRHFADLGARVTRRPFPRYHRLMVEPTSSRPCLRTIDNVAAWLARDALAQRRPPTSAPAVLHAPELRRHHWTEAPALFGSGGALVGILCEPATPSPARPCVALLGSGRDCHIGWARSHVLLARHLAAQGIASLRFDRAGIGDSLAGNPARRTPLYDLDAVADIRSAIDLLHGKSYRNIALYGACSGAYLAFHAAMADHRVRALVLRNIPRFVWTVASAVDFALAERFDALLAGPGSCSERPSVVEHSVGLLRSGKRGLNKLLAQLSDVRAEARYVQSQIRAFSDRGSRLLLVFGSDDAGRGHLDEMLGRDGCAVTGNCDIAVRFVDGVDHNFTSRYARHVLQDLLSGFLLGPGAARRPLASATPLRSADDIMVVREPI